jgi:hypothetical protein
MRELTADSQQSTVRIENREEEDLTQRAQRKNTEITAKEKGPSRLWASRNACAAMRDLFTGV